MRHTMKHESFQSETDERVNNLAMRLMRLCKNKTKARINRDTLRAYYGAARIEGGVLDRLFYVLEKEGLILFAVDAPSTKEGYEFILANKSWIYDTRQL